MPSSIFLISCLDWAIFYEFELTKNMTEYREDIINRPAYKKAMDHKTKKLNLNNFDNTLDNSFHDFPYNS